MANKFLKSLPSDAHKYSHGTVCIVAGSRAYSGAAVLCVGGARRGGSGYINYLALDRLPAFMVLRAYPDVVLRKKVANIAVEAWVIGSGSPQLPRNFQIPASAYVVLDSVAMSFVSDIHAQWKVITPHLGEARTLGFTIDSDLASRKIGALEIAKKLNTFVVLKGEETVIASADGELIVEDSGGPELSTAGTGDILAGLLGSMLASWKPENESAVLDVLHKTVRMHAAAGKLAAKKYAPVTATDVLEQLAKVDR